MDGLLSAALCLCAVGLPARFALKVGGGVGLALMAALTVLGRADLLTPNHLFLFQLVWMIPGLIASEWTRTV